MIEEFVSSFALAMVSEIADKTQLVAIGLALKYRSPVKVFAGAFAAHLLMDSAAVFLGASIGNSISLPLVKTITGVVFIGMGLFLLAKLLMDKNNHVEKQVQQSTGAFTASFLAIFVSEFGDKSQVAAGLLGARYLQPLPVILGFMTAIALVISFNIFIASKAAEKLPRKTLKLISTILFIGFGVATLLS